MKINHLALKAIYLHEMDRFRRTLTQSLLSPVLTTSLYFIVFGSVIGGYVEKIDGISYGSYIVPGLLMLTLLTQSISNTSFGILKYSIVLAKAKELGGIIHSFPILVTKLSFLNIFGS